MQENVLLKNYTTYKIGGPAKYFLDVKNKKDLIGAIEFAKKNKLKIFILGGGSNVLVSDKGFSGLVVKISNLEFEILNLNEVYAGAGVNLSKLAYFCAENGLSGLEWAAGIPGATVGGAIFGQAQAFGTRISDTIKAVEAIDLKTLKIKKFSKKQCQFSLKNSVFKKTKKYVIISAVLELQKKDIKKIKQQIKEFLKYRKNRHPMDFSSAGSIFVNPEIKGKTIPAGFLIAECGLAGKKIGQAKISEKHANFIINLGGASSGDVLALINLAKKKVEKKFKIKLKEEVQFVGF